MKSKTRASKISNLSQWLLAIATGGLMAGCSSPADSNGTPSSAFGIDCSYTISGSVAGSFSGAAGVIEAGYINHMCMHAVGSSLGPPQMNVVIKDTHFNGAGTYDLSNGVDMYVAFTEDGNVTYKSDGTSTNCTATFTSADAFTVACDNMPRQGGAGSVSLSNGSWSI